MCDISVSGGGVPKMMSAAAPLSLIEKYAYRIWTPKYVESLSQLFPKSQNTTFSNELFTI